jgi:hypothetical protein
MQRISAECPARHSAKVYTLPSVLTIPLGKAAFLITRCVFFVKCNTRQNDRIPLFNLFFDIPFIQTNKRYISSTPHILHKYHIHTYITDPTYLTNFIHKHLKSNMFTKILNRTHK